MSDYIERLFPSALGNLYGLPLRSAKLVSRRINVTFRLSADPGEFYLRLYRPRGRSREEIDGEISALLEFQSAYEVQVAKPQKLRAGGYVFSCPYKEENRFACLFAAALGRPASSNAADMRQFGVALAVLHSQTHPTTACGRPFVPAALIEETVLHLSECGPEFGDLCRKIKQIGLVINANLHEYDALRKGFCHGDAWCGNVHFFGPRTTFFDFDDCFDGPLVADLVTQIAWLWNATRPEFPFLVRVLLDAYTSLIPLSDADVAAIPSLVQLHEISAIAFLARYCSLDSAKWAECQVRSARILDDWSPGGAANSYFAPLTGAARMARTLVA